MTIFASLCRRGVLASMAAVGLLADVALADSFEYNAGETQVTIEGRGATLRWDAGTIEVTDDGGLLDPVTISVRIAFDATELRDAVQAEPVGASFRDDCGSTVRLESLALEPRGDGALDVDGRLNASYWECGVVEVLGVRVPYKTKIIDSVSGNVMGRLVPTIEGASVRISPWVDDVRIDRIPDELLRALGVRDGIVNELQDLADRELGSRPLVLRPPDDFPLAEPRITAAKFVAREGGRLGAELAGSGLVTPGNYLDVFKYLAEIAPQ